MASLEEYTTAKIRSLGYNEIIGIVRETNRPPGGKTSVFEIANRTFLNRHSHVLEIGTSTGFTAFELTRLTKCSVTAVDINQESLAEAKRRAEQLGLGDIRFENCDATDMPYDDETFDLTFCGNVIAHVPDKPAVVKECCRVTKYGGYIAAIPMYYVNDPPPPIVARVEAALQIPIEIQYREQVLGIIESPVLETYQCIDYVFDDIEPEKVRNHVDVLMNQEHIRALNSDVLRALRQTYTEYMMLFRENLAFMGFTILIFRKSRFIEDPELFTSRRLFASMIQSQG